MNFLVKKASASAVIMLTTLVAIPLSAGDRATPHRLPSDAQIPEWKLFLATNEPLFEHQWHLHNTGQGIGMFNRDVCAEKSWDITRGSSSVVIAIFDDGFDLAHPDLAANVYTNFGEYGSGKQTNGIDDDANGYIDDWRGWDFLDNDNDPSPATTNDNHGTTVAGIAVGIVGNAEGIAGLAHGCTFLPLRIAGSSASNAMWAAAIRYAADIADVLSISVATGEPDDELYSALNYALVHGRGGKGCVICAALGNDGIMRRYTADLAAAPEVVSVSGTSNYDRRSARANYGPSLNMVCPAGGGSRGILTTDRTGSSGYSFPADTNYVYRSGTSLSCPQAAAAAALLFSIDAAATGLEARRLLEAGCEKVDGTANTYDSTGRHPYYGHGRLNAWLALTSKTVTWDAYEDDDVFTQASPISDGELQYRSLDTGGDTDWVSFSLTASSTVQFAVLGATNTFLRLYDSVPSEIATDAGGGSNSSYMASALAAGTYYVRVESFGGTPVQQYGLHYGILNGQDSYEPDDTNATAKVITPRAMQYRTLYPPNDVDWATFTLTNTPNTDITLRTMGEWNGFLEMTLWDGTNMLAYDYNTNVNATISAQLAPGTYLVGVRDFDGLPVASYQLLLETYDADTREPNNGTNTAAVIVPGDRLDGTIWPEGESDWFEFSLPSASAVLIMTDTLNPRLEPVNGDTLLVLYGEDTNTVLRTSDEGNNASFSAIYESGLGPGRYYVEVRGGETNALCPNYYLALDAWEMPAAIDSFGIATNTVQIGWEGNSLFTYTVEKSTNLLSTSAWVTAGSHLEGSIGSNFWSAADLATNMFYRIISK